MIKWQSEKEKENGSRNHLRVTLSHSQLYCIGGIFNLWKMNIN